jgi:hypothetical protein
LRELPLPRLAGSCLSSPRCSVRIQRGMQHVLRQLVEQPVRRDQLHALPLRLGQQLLGQLPLIHFSRASGLR